MCRKRIHSEFEMYSTERIRQLTLISSGMLGYNERHIAIKRLEDFLEWYNSRMDKYVVDGYTMYPKKEIKKFIDFITSEEYQIYIPIAKNALLSLDDTNENIIFLEKFNNHIPTTTNEYKSFFQ